MAAVNAAACASQRPTSLTKYVLPPKSEHSKYPRKTVVVGVVVVVGEVVAVVDVAVVVCVVVVVGELVPVLDGEEVSVLVAVDVSVNVALDVAVVVGDDVPVLVMLVVGELVNELVPVEVAVDVGVLDIVVVVGVLVMVDVAVEVAVDVAEVVGVVISHSLNIPLAYDVIAADNWADVVLHVSLSPRYPSSMQAAAPTAVPRECSEMSALVVLMVCSHSVSSLTCCNAEYPSTTFPQTTSPVTPEHASNMLFNNAA
jgi:hypothetical protein